MEKDKMIEEMVKIANEKHDKEYRNLCTAGGCAKCISEALYEAGYRKFPEGAVVLTGIDKGTMYAKVKEGAVILEDMIESKQAVILPCNCKIGDLVYGVADYLSKPKPGILTSVEITKYCIQYGIVDKRLMRHDVEYVYPTAEKEAAEAKLKELRGE